ncbi:hypothetical protein [uncultured Jannaschia sp.]|uniref:hypothetical protein n=1 Tax=uncultured Jannaschia sp. TaxID=293347 RepID=UPI002620F318|nr:hypothetical protein [uncultured Jannaschia sp.]
MAPLDHLVRLTDDCGIWQHARRIVPDRRHGYCLDDVSRALWLCARRARLDPADPLPGRLAVIYASFVDHAWDAEAGGFRNFLSHDRQWIGGPDEDASARTLLTLAETALAPLPDGIGKWARECLRDALPSATTFRSPRPWAWALGALSTARELDLPVDAPARTLADRLLDLWQRAPGDTFEAELAYDSPRLAQGALDGARWRGELAEAGLAALREMSRIQTAEDGAFRPPGSNAYGRPGGPARYAQQPLDAWAQVEATLAAHTLTGDADWTRKAQRAHAWFLGRNEVGRPLVTPDGGCRDGIDPQGISVNQGAESTLAWLHTDAVMALAGLVPGPVDRHRIT